MIELRDVCVSFDGQAVLEHLSADIPAEGVTVVSGASGSGKTTLLRVIAGLQKPDIGTITGADDCVISFVFQEDRLLPWMTALENVALVSDIQTACAMLTALGLGDALYERPAQLSGGMKRRVAIARALAYQSDLLLLDEPFNGLDADAKATAARAILDQKRAIVLVTHSREDAELLCAKTTIALTEPFTP